jgi:hypothetical protein
MIQDEKEGSPYWDDYRKVDTTQNVKEVKFS